MLEFCPRQSYVTGIIKNTNFGFKLKENFFRQSIKLCGEGFINMSYGYYSFRYDLRMGFLKISLTCHVCRGIVFLKIFSQGEIRIRIG